MFYHDEDVSPVTGEEELTAAVLLLQVPDHRELHSSRGEEQDHEQTDLRHRGGSVEVPAPRPR